MTVAYWITILVAAVAIAAAAGFAAGRGSAPSEQRLRTMTRERDAARAEAEQVRAEVDRHFEESARMFGRLADDYRTFFEHFARTAQQLGMSEGRARALLHEADPRLAAPEATAARAAPPDAEDGAAARGASPTAADEVAAAGAAGTDDGIERDVPPGPAPAAPGEAEAPHDGGAAGDAEAPADAGVPDDSETPGAGDQSRAAARPAGPDGPA